jgi:hypothetical protein
MNTEVALEYFQEGGLVNTVSEGISKWNTQLNRGQEDNPDEIDITFDIPIGEETNFDELIPMADGCVYFVNPNVPAEFELFKEIYKILQSVRREIHGVVVFYDPDAFIGPSSNVLCKKIWEDFPCEVFVANSGTDNQLNEIIPFLCDAMISGEIIVNPHLSWMEIPILYAKAQTLINNQRWAQAAFFVEKLAKIFRILEKSEWLLYAEQAAWLYSQENMFLKAANCVKSFNSIQERKYKEEFVRLLLEGAHDLQKQKKYAQAAQSFEKAGNWAGFELDNKELVGKSLQMAIFAWIDAEETQNAFTLIERFEYFEKIRIMEQASEKIAAMADRLSNQGEHGLAKAQLYLCFQRFQKAGLFESIKMIAHKSAKLLKKILHQNIEDRDVDTAKMTLDELYNIWESYDIEPENIDSYLLQIGELFVKRHDFQKVEVLLPKMESGQIKAKLTEYRSVEEERIKDDRKKGEQAQLYLGLEILDKYIQEETTFLTQKNQQISSEVQKLATDHLSDAIHSLKSHIHWLESLEFSTFSKQMWMEVLDLYLRNQMFPEFLQDISSLPEKERKIYLFTHSQLLGNNLQQVSHEINPDSFVELITQVMKLYRSHLLYEESRIFSEDLIKFLMHLGETYAAKGNHKSILNAIEITLQIETISQSYLEGKSYPLDKIYKKVVEYYLSIKNLKDARSFSDKIYDSSISAKYYMQIDDIETERSNVSSLKVQKDSDKKYLADQLSKLQNLARDQQMSAKNLLRMRKGLKRRYFQKALDLILANNFFDASDEYFTIATSMVSTKKFELAGTSASIGVLLYLILKKFNDLTVAVDKFRDSIGATQKIFDETFPGKIIIYIMQMIHIGDLSRLRSALQLYKVLALFPEELLILETLIGENINFQDILNKSHLTKDSGSSHLPSNYSRLLDKLTFDPKQNTRRISLELKYWTHCQDLLAQQEYEEASLVYLNLVNDLIGRQYWSFVIDSIVMSFLILLKVKPQAQVFREFEKFNFRVSKTHAKLAHAEELMLLEMFLQFWEDPKAKGMIIEIAQAFQSKLSLFDWEKALIRQILVQIERPPSIGTSSAVPRETSVAPGDVEEDPLLNQQIVVLTQELTAKKEDFAILKEKRGKMVRTYYQEILENLQAENFMGAANRYMKLAKRMARRNDFEASSLMVLLSLLARLRGKVSPTESKAQIDLVLNKLGIVEKILNDQFAVKLGNLIVDIINNRNQTLINHLEDILACLPLLPQETSLAKLEFDLL